LISIEQKDAAKSENSATVSDHVPQSARPRTCSPYPDISGRASDDEFSAGRALDRTPATDQVVYQDDHCDYYQDVNQVAAKVADESQ
jgi:hypothetical protein